MNTTTTVPTIIEGQMLNDFKFSVMKKKVHSYLTVV